MSVAAPVRLRRTVLAVPASALLGNLVAYTLLLVAARVLDHGEYGSLVTLTTLMLVGAVPSLAVQAVTARRVAAGESTATMPRIALALGALAAALLAACAVPLAGFVDIDSTPAVWWLAVALVPVTVTGVQIGVAQGHERLGTFASLTLLQAIGRFGGALLPLLLGHGEAGAMAGSAIGTTLAVAIGAGVLSRAGLSSGGASNGLRPLLVECGHAVHGYAAVLLLTGLDLLLARHVLAAGQASEYAAGSVVSRAVVWLPQSIGLIVFARMSVHEGRRTVTRQAAALVAGIGLLATLGAWLFGGLVQQVVGPQFAVLRTSAWVFALLGTALAVSQFCVVAGLAARSPRRFVVLWCTMAAEAVVIPLLGSSASATLVAACAAAVVAGGALVAVWLAAELPVPWRR